MDHAFSIFMFIFAGALLLYAGLMAVTRDDRLLPPRARIAAKPKNKKACVFQLSKGVAVSAAAPALGGLAGLWNAALGLVALLIGLAVCLWLGTKIVKRGV